MVALEHFILVFCGSDTDREATNTMYGNNYPSSVWDKLTGTTDLTGQRAAVIKQTYLLFGLSVISALVGGYIGATSETLARFFSGWLGWIVAILLLNVVPAGGDCRPP